MIKVSTTDKILRWGSRDFPCAIGKNGAAGDKTEGDGKTPLGIFPLLQVFWRKDRIDLPKISLPKTEIVKDSGWCDDPNDAAYNFPVKLPYTARHEMLWRDDGCYNVFVVIGYNRNPTIRGKGSAIFLHCAHDDASPTAGCVAIAQKYLLEILPELTPQTMIEIR